MKCRPLKTAHYLEITLFALCLLPPLRCDFPYDPVPQLQPAGGQATDTASMLYPINIGRQICNPSASRDTINFRACMLYLNLGGNLPVTVPEKWKNEYTPHTETPHDRLTIIDTLNTVRWFLMKPSCIPQKELQDPEWSTHPGYIAFLGDADDATDGYIIRIHDKTMLRFNNGMLQANSTPHLWIGEGITVTTPNFDAPASLFNEDSLIFDASTGMVDKASVVSFFKTDSVKIAFAKKSGSSGLTIHYTDYSLETPTRTMLPRPNNREGFACESPLISPDGQWIVFNCKNGNLACESYLQRLAPGARPIVLREGVSAEPHWWRDPANGAVSVLFSTVIGPLSRDLAQTPRDGSYGSTIIKNVNLASSLAWQVAHGAETVLSGLPFQGGLTPDGRYLVTGYEYGYIMAISR